MLCSSLVLRRHQVAYQRKLRRKFRSGQQSLLPQTLKQRSDTIETITKKRMTGSHMDGKSRRNFIEESLYSSGARADRDRTAGVNRTYALQGLGDLEPLRSSSNFGLSEGTMMKYSSTREMAKYEAPPIPYTPLAARKLAQGNFWPSAPEPTNVVSKEVQRLRHEKNMSPSATKFCTQMEYYLRRDLKSCPAHIAEAIDFAQLIIKEILGSRRSKHVHIVWTTVHPGARFEIEPHLLKLSRWVQLMILRRIKNRPNIPKVTWVYDSGNLQRELPRELQNKLEAALVSNSSTLEDRLQYLKKLDTVDARMKGIPWFMPYLWSKDKKMSQRKEIQKDYEEVTRRKKEHLDGGTAHRDARPEFTS